MLWSRSTGETVELGVDWLAVKQPKELFSDCW